MLDEFPCTSVLVREKKKKNQQIGEALNSQVCGEIGCHLIKLNVYKFSENITKSKPKENT